MDYSKHNEYHIVTFSDEDRRKYLKYQYEYVVELKDHVKNWLYERFSSESGNKFDQLASIDYRNVFTYQLWFNNKEIAIEFILTFG